MSTTEGVRIRQRKPDAPAYDAYTCLLQRLPPDTRALGREVVLFVRRKAGVLVVDNITLDKPYARRLDLVTRHWSETIRLKSLNFLLEVKATLV